MLERTGRGFLSGCSCLLPALPPSPITVRRLASVTDSVQVRNNPESNNLSAPNATSAEGTRTLVTPHVTFGPFSIGGSRWRCRKAPDRLRRHVAPGCRLAGRRRPNVPGQSPARYNMGPLLLD